MEVQKMASKKLKEITTKSGFTVAIDPAIGDDMEIIDELQNLVTGRGNASPGEVVAMMIGQEGKEAMYEHCRVNGRVSAKKIGEELQDVMNAAVEMLKKA